MNESATTWHRAGEQAMPQGREPPLPHSLNAASLPGPSPQSDVPTHQQDALLEGLSACDGCQLSHTHKQL